MQVKLAESYGFCFGVKRAIRMAESHTGSVTLGPLIHNPQEIDRLKNDFSVGLANSLDEIKDCSEVVIRTHGITKQDLSDLQFKTQNIVDATCPFVTKPQEICAEMSSFGYDIVIFGDENHPEVRGVKSYASTNVVVVLKPQELFSAKLGDKVAVVSQTTRKASEFLDIVNYLIPRHKETRVFNTICNATGDNQDAARALAKEVDVMVIVGGKHSSNTKQLFDICKAICDSSYLIETDNDINEEWFKNKTVCGVTAGASTPDWVIEAVYNKIKNI
jgi:4-hydroxy-3-methylbut-2-enyl diphosphate reductase